MKDTKVIHAMIEDTIETVKGHTFSMAWLEDRIYKIVEMSEDVKRIWIEEEIIRASNDVNSPSNTQALEELIIKRISNQIFGRE